MKKPNQPKYYGIYRGEVLNNRDSGVDMDGTSKFMGRCKIFFPGIYPTSFKASFGKLLPWAEPVFPISGGNAANATQKLFNTNSKINPLKNWTNKFTGWTATPHVGAMVWGFFEDGNINYPKFFGVTMGGNNFGAEHPEQAVYMSDNVKIVIDENPLSSKSTNKFDSNNAECTTTANSIIFQKKQMPTTVNIEITNLKPPNIAAKDVVETDATAEDYRVINEENKAQEDSYKKTLSDNDFCAINLNIKGNVNANIQGDMFLEHTGNKFVTHTGNTFIKQIGDVEIEQHGLLKHTVFGERILTVSDQEIKDRSKKATAGNNTELVCGYEKRTVLKDQTEDLMSNRVINIAKADSRTANMKISDKCQIITHN